MPNQPPCIYDIDENIIYEFSGEYGYEKCDFAFWLNGNVGLLYISELDEDYVRTGNEKYQLFHKK